MPAWRAKRFIRPHDGKPFPADGHAPDVEHDQPADFQFHGNRVGGNKRNAKPGHDGLLDCFVRCHFGAEIIQFAGYLAQEYLK